MLWLLLSALKCFVIAMLICVLAIGMLRLATKIRLQKLKSFRKVADGEGQPRIIGFFHPACDSMGGGEKVLYQALKALQ